MSTFKILPVELKSLSDVARLACALEKVPKPIFAISSGNSYMMGVTAEWIDGHLVFLYSSENPEEVRDYLCYRLEGGREEVFFTFKAEKLPTICSPIIKLKTLPRGSLIKNPRSISLALVEVEDIQSLVKMGLYRVIMDEPPAPILYVPYSHDNLDKGVLGSFVRASEDDKSILFMYIESVLPPAYFLKVDPNESRKIEYTMSVDEPGYMYVKLARARKPVSILLP